VIVPEHHIPFFKPSNMFTEKVKNNNKLNWFWLVMVI
jgi:hypothetical protein